MLIDDGCHRQRSILPDGARARSAANEPPSKLSRVAGQAEGVLRQAQDERCLAEFVSGNDKAALALIVGRSSSSCQECGQGWPLLIHQRARGHRRTRASPTTAITEDRTNKWCSLRDSNSCSRLERAVSWATRRRERIAARRASIAKLFRPAMAATGSPAATHAFRCAVSVAREMDRDESRRDRLHSRGTVARKDSNA